MRQNPAGHRVEVEATCCPGCGGTLLAAEVEWASVTELPKPQPEVRVYAVEGAPDVASAAFRWQP